MILTNLDALEELPMASTHSGGPARPDPAKCLTPDCPMPVHRRGCCLECLAVHQHRVWLHSTTWPLLEARGLVLPPEPEVNDGPAKMGRLD